jgi:hypothetical protein
MLNELGLHERWWRWRGVSVKALNQAVKRTQLRFPADARKPIGSKVKESRACDCSRSIT